MKPPRLASLMLILALAPAPALAQMDPIRGAGAAQRVLAREQRDAALDAVAKSIPEQHIFPEKAPAILAAFAQKRAAGRYDTLDPDVLADRVTEDLRAISGDRHLYLLHDPEQYAAAANDAAEAGGQDRAAFFKRLAIREHHGLAELKILPGNIRYLKITAFHWIPDETGTIYDGAMRFLKDGDAIIIDIRGNAGGSHAVRYLVSHFMEPDKLEVTFLARGQPPEQSRTLDHLPAGRIKDKPLYVLIDGNVGSAAEAFAYDVQQFKLGRLVGSRTAGAANNNAFTPVAPGFMLSIPVGRPEHAVSGTNWEAVGIAPDTEAPVGLELPVAQSLALTTLGEAADVPAPRRAEYEWAKVAADAQIQPISLDGPTLKRYAGGYGPNDIRLIEGALWLIRTGRPSRKLVPLTANGLFAVESSDLLRVRFGKDLMETLWMGDPVPRRFPRG